jgi:universal stress protein A
MATHGRGGLSHVLMGSVAEHVVRKGPCPVLTLKQPMTVSADMGLSDD